MRNLLVVVMFLAGISLLVGTTILAQGSRSRERDIQKGKTLFHRKDSPTGIACIHCHADFNEKKEPDDHVRPAHPLFNGGFRAEWQSWDGRKITTLDLAISTCMQRWITERGKDGGKTPAKHEIRQLKAYLRSDKLSPEKKSKPIEPNFTKQLPRERVLRAGDPTLGSTVFRKSCTICHATDGSGPAPSLLRNGYSRYQIAKKIREIDNPGLNGLVMPPFPMDRLSDRQLINVVAFVYQM